MMKGGIKGIKNESQHEIFASSLFLEAHARRGAEGGEDGSRYWGDNLHNPLQRFSFRHNYKLLIIHYKLSTIN